MSGWILLALGLFLYLGAIFWALWRTSRQYSSAMAGSRGLGIAAALTAAGTYWYFLLVAVVGAALTFRGR